MITSDNKNAFVFYCIISYVCMTEDFCIKFMFIKPNGWTQIDKIFYILIKYPLINED